MQSKIIVTIVATMLLFSVASGAVLAKEEGDLIKELTEIDAFHPPEINDPRLLTYNEWHYFNVVAEEDDLSVVATLKLSGDIYNPLKSSAVVMLGYSTPDGVNMTGDFYLITQVRYSNETPDLQISNSTVTLTEEGYHVHLESANNQTVFDAKFKPVTGPAPIFTISYDQYQTINWLVASPKMKVTGKLTINKGTQEEKTYTLKNTRGYHDHNWGFWLWQGDIGWDWGQVTETKDHLEGNDLGKYTLCFGNVTNNNHTESRGAVLNIGKNKKIIETFKNDEMQIQHYNIIAPIPQLPNNSFPGFTVLTADSGENSMRITFNTEYFAPLPIPIGINKYLVIWELTGTYNVNGYIDGKPVSYTAKGFMEYVA
ncbi:MAG: hypothetical protein WAV32_08810 [Halobacteriota archaeon]